MFSDSPVEVVGFNHTKTSKKGTKEVSCQYNGPTTDNKSCNTVDMKSISIQTNEMENVNIGNADVNVNEKLKNCLERGLQFLTTEYTIKWPMINDNFDTTDKCINNDNIINVSLKPHFLFGMTKMSALSWNCTGDKLMLATGEHDHAQWCNHLNSVFVYSMSDLENGGSIVSNKLDVTSCVTCLASHPTNEDLITAGLYNGELLVCHINDNMTTVSLEWHSQAVTNTVWFVRSDQRVVLVTAGKDGYVCIGTMMSDKIKFTHRICRYLVGIPDKVGIRCFDYSDRHFLVALENGMISSYLSEMTRHIKEDQVLEAVKVKAYDGSSVIIENLKFCHTNSRKFVVTQFDCTVILYDVYQMEPQKIIFNSKLITSLCWSLNNEFTIYVGEENGELATINLINGKTDSIIKITNCRLTLMRINPIRRNIIAVGTVHGETFISKYE